jgi:phosphoglycerol transferase
MALGQSCLIAAALYLFVGGWQRDLGVPLGFSSDTLWFLMQSKSTLDNGWWWSNPRLGAPFAFDALAYPSNSNVDQAIVWMVGRFVSQPAAVVTLAWATTVIASGLTAAWCLRRLGVSAASAFMAGTLFALSPYALYRHIDHFSLVTYLVPFACAAAVWLASGRPLRDLPGRTSIVVLAGCALLGFNYVYYAFFGAFCVTAGAVIGYVARRDRRILASGVLCVAVISGCTLVNLIPSFVSWGQNGRPLMMRDKVPAEAEMFGLKIRQLVSPVFPNRIPPLQHWVRQEEAARFPIETENWTARLGLAGTAGFLGLLALLFVPDAADRAHRAALSRTAGLLKSASRLTIAAVLLATVGGFGSLFSLFVSADIRAYNRICPFIEFFALLAVALAIDALCQTRRARLAAASVVLAIGLADQGQAAQGLQVKYASIASEVSGLERFMRTVERAVPHNAMVLQLPFRTYLNESDAGRMKRYDHLKPYLLSRSLRFSYPALSDAQVRWQQSHARLNPANLAARSASEGFAVVLVDRYGYDDNGAAITSALLRTVGDTHVIAQTDRYLALDIRGLAGNASSPAASELVSATLSLTACKGQPPMTVIDQIGSARAPFGAGSVHVSGANELRVSGWAVDHPSRLAAAGVDVVIDRTPFPSTYGSNRDDVADYFQRPAYRESGFAAGIPAGAIARGEHALMLRVVASDGQCYYQTRPIPVTVD